MGKIKTKLIKRTAEKLIQKEIAFDDTFEKNKKILGKEMPSKKVRNQIAGYLARLLRREKTKKEELEKAIKLSKK
jgi:small subunit ribosomal protein S17e